MASDDDYVCSMDSSSQDDESFVSGNEDVEAGIGLVVPTSRKSKRRHSGGPSTPPTSRRKSNTKGNIIPVENALTLDQLIALGESYNSKYTYSIDGVDKIAAATPALRKLAALHGLDEVKKMAVRQVKYLVQGLSSDDDFLHTCLYGPPGTGKTSIIGILGEIFAATGFLKHGRIHSVTRSDLIGEYVGHTAPKTLAAVKKAFGGVLLIDEFYSLGSAKDSNDGFDRECIDTLNQCLSEHRHEFVCVVAGYEEDINKYIWPMNKGLRRRFPWQYTITEYTTDDMMKILDTQVAKQGWVLSVDAIAVLKAAVHNGEVKFKNFGGDTESLLTKCKIAYGDRIFGSPHDYTISADDMSEAIAMYNGPVTKSVDLKWEQDIRWRMYT